MPLLTPWYPELDVHVIYQYNSGLLHHDVCHVTLVDGSFTLNYIFNGATVPNIDSPLVGEQTVICIHLRPRRATIYPRNTLRINHTSTATNNPGIDTPQPGPHQPTGVIRTGRPTRIIRPGPTPLSRQVPDNSTPLDVLANIASSRLNSQAAPFSPSSRQPSNTQSEQLPDGKEDEPFHPKSEGQT